MFKLTPAPKGFTERVLFRFDATNNTDYNELFGPSDLIADQAGNLLGVADLQSGFGLDLRGNVFELMPTSKGYVFHLIAADMAGPIIADSAGALYGIGGGFSGGNPYGYCTFGGCANVDKLTPSISGYQASAIFHFPDPNDLHSGLAMDKSGAFYGTIFTQNADPGPPNLGYVYKLTPSTSGYRESILHQFNAPGSNLQPYPLGNLAIDATGAVFGTSLNGGRFGLGTVYKLTPTKLGYSFRTIYDFAGGSDGQNPFSPLVLDGAGSIYGTAGTQCCTGASIPSTVFKLTPNIKNGETVYRETVLHRFTNFFSAVQTDGAFPQGPLLIGPGGAVFGTTPNGGTFGDGTVYELQQ